MVRRGQRSLPGAASGDEPNVRRILPRFGLPRPGSASWSGAWPDVEVSAIEKEVEVVAELPGMEEKVRSWRRRMQLRSALAAIAEAVPEMGTAEALLLNGSHYATPASVLPTDAAQ